MGVRLEANDVRVLGRAITNGQGCELPITAGPPFVGDGSGITNLNASELTSGTIPSARMPYKIYRALLTQVVPSAPVATVLENTLGAIVWARSSLGVYTATLANAFTVGKTHTITGSDWILNATFTVIQTEKTSSSVITITTIDVDISGPTAAPNDGLLSSTSITILVYP